MAKVSFVDNAKALIALQDKLRRESNQRVYVGILAEDGAVPKQERQSPASEQDAVEGPVRQQTLIEVAIVNEFGGFGPQGNEIPKRSFIRGWVDESRKEIEQRMAQFLIAEVRQGGLARFHMAMPLGLTGIWAQGMIQKRISDRIPPPNAPYTIEKKGSDVPLIDTGQLRSAISWKVMAR